MKKNKRLSYKKIQKINKQKKAQYLKLLRNYSIKQWLVCIQNLNIKDFDNPNSNLKYKPEFLTVNADYNGLKI